eukprot:gene36195-43903_t
MSEGIEGDFALELEALTLVEQLQKERESLIESRRQNLPKNVSTLRSAFANNKNVKSDLKKSNTFVKKVKTINAEGIKQCLVDAETLNLTQFVSEIVAAVLATNYKATDVGLVVKLCVSLHQKYEDFTEPLISGMKSSLLSPEDDADAGKKRRIQIRLAIELYQAGLFNDDDFFCQLLRTLLGKAARPNLPPPPKPIMDLPSLSTFVKYGYEVLLGYAPRKSIDVILRGGKTQADVVVKVLVTPRVLADLRGLLQEAYKQLCEGLVKAHKDYYSKSSKAEKDKLIHGSLSEAKQAELDGAQKLYERLLQVVQSISEFTGDPVPDLVVEKEEEGGGSKLQVWDAGTGGSDEVAGETGGPYGDAETRALYEDLPDLLSLVPLAILGLTPEQAAAMRADWEKAKEKEKDESEAKEDLAVVEEEKVDSMVVGEGEGALEQEVEDAPEGEADAASLPAPSLAVPLEGVELTKQEKLEQLLNETLPNCVTPQKCDEFCVAFCYLNSKGARKQLVYALGRIPRGRGELCVWYARIVATLSRLYSDMVEPLLESLRREFYGMVHTKKQANIEGKVRNVRYQAELVKFKVAPPIFVLRVIKTLLADFTPTHVVLLCTVMEACGRYLFLLPHTHALMEGYVQSMLRLRHARHLDLYHQTLIDSAYFSVLPPVRIRRKGDGEGEGEQETVVQKYIKYIILHKLGEPGANVDDIITSLRRLPWTSPTEDVLNRVLRCMLRIAYTHYTTIPALADTISGLNPYHSRLTVTLVDCLWEHVQIGLEVPLKRDLQRTLGVVRLFGELYNF